MTGSAIERPATAHGWLRRPELDTVGCEAWELPDGSLHAAYPGSGEPIIASYIGPAFHELYRRLKAGERP